MTNAILDGLNPAQKEAVEAIQGAVLIVAGPGSGKTRVITHRIAHLIQDWGISPYHILAVTFTNKAAKEMEGRLFDKSQKDGAAPLLSENMCGKLTIGTFHAICAKFLHIDGHHIGIDRNYTIYDDSDRLSLIKRALEQLKLDVKTHKPRPLQYAISEAKSNLLTPEDKAGQAESYFDEVVQRVYEKYEQLLKDNNALDFDDLMMKAVQLFESQPEVLEKYQSRYLHVMVDEFQDTNLVQYTLVKQLAAKHRNICVVGDPDQSIYSWRQADIRNILSFESDYPEGKAIYLEQNYRSSQTILEAADCIISQNLSRKEMALWTKNPKGAHITVAELYDEREEAQYLVSEVEKLVTSKRYKLADCAIMYRTNAQSRAIEEAFMRYGIPYRLVGATKFYERKEIKDVLAYLRLIYNPADSISFLRIVNVPLRGIGQKSIEELARVATDNEISLLDATRRLIENDGMALAKKFKTFLDIIDELMAKAKDTDAAGLIDLVLSRAGYEDYIMADEAGEDRLDNVMELRAVADDLGDLGPEESLAAFLEGVALVSDLDSLEGQVDAATMITLHQAKGLEFPVVFIAGMEEHLLPHFRSFDDAAQMEEERRLCYVGVTRAKEKVYLTRAFRRHMMGVSNPNAPSRFLDDIPDKLIETPEQPKKQKVSRILLGSTSHKGFLKAGDKVRHETFGDGIIVASFPAKDDQEITVAFKGGVGLKRMMVSMANLEKI
ncbi:ATP-dependent helicase [Chloroflexota bacterium]